MSYGNAYFWSKRLNPSWNQRLVSSRRYLLSRLMMYVSFHVSSWGHIKTAGCMVESHNSEVHSAKKNFGPFYIPAFKPADQTWDGGSACRVTLWKLHSSIIWVHGYLLFSFWVALDSPLLHHQGEVWSIETPGLEAQKQIHVCLCMYGLIYIYSKADSGLGWAESWAVTRTEEQSTQLHPLGYPGFIW